MESDEGRSFAVELESLAIPFENRTISVKDTCMALEGLVRQPSVHAAGVVVADRPLIELAPLYKKNKDAELVIQYDMRDAEELGLLKLDVLGLRTVTVIGEAEALVRRNDPSFSIKSVPLDDPDTFRLLAAGDTGAVFQLEGDGITAACTGMRPDRFEDIIALIALYRPGPMEQLGSYFRRKHGEEEVEYVHPLLEPVLKRSYGLIVYQEQVMGIVRALGGYSAGEADMFRKAIGKKLVPLIEAEIAKFVDRAIANGHDEHIVRSIGDQIFFFGRYGFNLGHATGYAFITYWTAYLKANFPTEFFTANLNSQVGNLDNISRLLRDANKHGISIEPPDINESGVGFTHVAVNKIRFGLGGVKGLGDTAVQDILEERDSEEKNCYAGKRVTRQKPDGKEYAATIRAVTRIKNRPHPYADAHDFCKRLPHLTIVMKRNLAIAGAFGADPDYRRRLYGALEQINTLAKKGKPFHVSEYDGPIMPEAELIKKEREIIGLYLTKHPLELYMRDIEQYGATINGSFDDLHASCVVAGLVESKRVHQASSGEMAWVTLENEIDGMVDVTIFNKTWMRVRDKIVDGAVIVAMCKKEHHPKFGWGLKASDVRVLDRARSAAKSITVTVPVADASDMIELARLTDTTGVPLRVVIGTQDRWVSIKCNRKINMTPAVDSYLAQLDMKINNDVIDIEDLGYTSVSPFVGAGPSRQSLYNRPLIKKALELFDAQAECTLIKVST